MGIQTVTRKKRANAPVMFKCLLLLVSSVSPFVNFVPSVKTSLKPKPDSRGGAKASSQLSIERPETLFKGIHSGRGEFVAAFIICYNAFSNSDLKYISKN